MAPHLFVRYRQREGGVVESVLGESQVGTLVVSDHMFFEPRYTRLSSRHVILQEGASYATIGSMS